MRDRRGAGGRCPPLHRAQRVRRSDHRPPRPGAGDDRSASRASSTSSSSTPTRAATSTTTRPCLPRLSERGLIAADNTLSGGRVLETTRGPDGDRCLQRACHERRPRDLRPAPVRDGVTLIRRRYDRRRAARPPRGGSRSAGATAARTVRARRGRSRSATPLPTRPSTRNVGTDGGFFVSKTTGRYSSGRMPVRRAWTSITASHSGRKRTGAGVSAGGSGARGRSSSSRPPDRHESGGGAAAGELGASRRLERPPRTRRPRSRQGRSRADTSAHEMIEPVCLGHCRTGRPTARRAHSDRRAAAPTCPTAARGRAPPRGRRAGSADRRAPSPVSARRRARRAAPRPAAASRGSVSRSTRSCHARSARRMPAA